MKATILALVCLTTVLGAGPAIAQGDTTPDQRAQADVIATVDRFIAAISSNDAAVLEELYLPQADLFVLRPGPDGSRVFRPRSASADVAETLTETRHLREYYWNPTVLVHGGIALFWAPYAFEIEGNRVHCGIDTFDLVQVDGKWRIASVMYTVEPDGCPAP